MRFIEPLPQARDAGYVLTPAQMRAVDQHAIESLGVPGVALMENAARQVALAVARRTPAQGRVAVVCGRGNNGGDGYAAARHLAAWGYTVEVVKFGGGQLSPDAATHLAVAEHLGLSVRPVDDMATVATLPPPKTYATLVDALFGTGLRGPVTGGARELVAWINGHGAQVVAVDIPSGLCGRTGRPLGLAVRADLTVTFAASKTGHWLHPGPEHVGRLQVVDIGLPPGLVGAHAGGRVVLGDDALAKASTPRRLDDHKGRLGHLLVLAGAPGRSGAARLAAGAALRAGAGLVTTAVDARIWSQVAAAAWETMTELGPDPEQPVEADVARLRALLAQRSAWVVGPGLDPSSRTQALLRGLLPEVERPAVVDAEALNQLAAEPALLGQGGPRIITPHPGEAARLLGIAVAEVQADRLGALDALVAATNAVVVLKGAHTWVGAPDGRRGVCPDGNPGMATAGSGDVLAGVIGALLARGLDPWAAASAGVVWHGRAGDAACAASSANAVTARALIDALPTVERPQC